MDERLDVEGAEHVLGDSVAGVRQHHTSHMAQITHKHLCDPLQAPMRVRIDEFRNAIGGDCHQSCRA